MSNDIVKKTLDLNTSLTSVIRLDCGKEEASSFSKENIEYKTFSLMVKLINNSITQYIKTRTCPNGFDDIFFENDYIAFKKRVKGGGLCSSLIIEFEVDSSTGISTFDVCQWGEIPHGYPRQFDLPVKKEYEYFIKSCRRGILSRRYLFEGHIKKFDKYEREENCHSFSFEDKTDCIIKSLIDLQSKVIEEVKRKRVNGQ